ncbi:Manganese transporter smf1 [Polyrhizophydium stewartii]|uniref:Manganese transporter smf1 n=1 Tax=Polyrhizophydium stewartii TaxID=2732419 RepID=A0ABR4NEC9_9FUNG|nr:hypothetical protein HK105_002622 [Polyrhizophydium stewartii]
MNGTAAKPPTAAAAAAAASASGAAALPAHSHDNARPTDSLLPRSAAHAAAGAGRAPPVLVPLRSSSHPPTDRRPAGAGQARSAAARSDRTWREWFTTLGRFIGPGYLVAIGYFDPGNWATDLSAGSQFGYKLLFIILLSNLMAIVLQSTAAKLGVVSGLDLASASRKHCPPWLNLILYVLCEIAIIACDLAEVIGSAIALKLLFRIPLFAGVLITGLDVMVILFGWNAKHLKIYEVGIILVVASVAICFGILIAKANPDWGAVFLGFLPEPSMFADRGSVYNAVGIIGATVMPHNLYLHSSVVRYRTSRGSQAPGEIREIDSDGESLMSDSPEDGAAADDDEISAAPRAAAARGDDGERRSHTDTSITMTMVDTVIALSIALLINSSILIVAAATFHASGNTDVADLEDAYNLMVDMLGRGPAVLFAVGLLLSGQSSTITGTLAGQFIMEGFLGSRFHIPAWLRRLITRSLAIIPALTIVLVYGDRGINTLLVLSQIVLSLQLPFAIWPLIYFTCSREIMTMRPGVAAGAAGAAGRLARGGAGAASAATESFVGTASFASYAAGPSAAPAPAGASDSTSDMSTLAGAGAGAGAAAGHAATGRADPVHQPKPDVEDQTDGVCYANSWPFTVLVSAIGLVITIFNIVLLVQIVTGTST